MPIVTSDVAARSVGFEPRLPGAVQLARRDRPEHSEESPDVELPDDEQTRC